jgi:acyl carrier protein
MQRAAAQLDFDTNKLRTLIAKYVGIEAELVTDEAHLTDDLGLDWLDQLELMVLIEDEFVGSLSRRLTWSAILSGTSNITVPC